MIPISGTEVHPGRVKIDGVFDGNWGYSAEFNFAINKTELKYIKAGYEADNGAIFYLGNQKQPYSLSLEMSSNDIPFVERSLDNFLVDTFTDRTIGARCENSDSSWLFAGGIFGDSLKQERITGDEGWGNSAWLVYSPITEENSVVNLGIRGSYREIDLATRTLSIKNKTTDFSELNIVSTGALIDAKSGSLLGPEIAPSFKTLCVFAEYTSTQVSRKGGSSLDFLGGKLLPPRV